MKRLALILSFIFISACSTLSDIDPNTPEGAFELAKRYEKADRYREAILRYTEVRKKYPYSKYAVESQLQIADIEYKREFYVEAANAYQIFREVNPKFPRLEYVIYRIGMSYYHQIPEIIARDLSASNEALSYFSEYLRKYPNGSWANELKEKQEEIYGKLAKKEIYIGDFYFKRKKYISALGRYKVVPDQFAFLSLSKEAALKAVESALELEFNDMAKQYLGFLEKRFPNSKEFKQAQEKGKEYGLL